MANSGINIKGEREILNNLTKANVNLRRALAAGLIDSTAYIESESNKIAPRKHGFLRISSFTTDIDNKREVQVGRIGYEAVYAPHVHEMPATFNYTTPRTGPKFLEKATKKTRQIRSIFVRTATRVLSSWQ